MTKVETLANKIKDAVREGYRTRKTNSGSIRTRKMFDKITIEGGYNGPLLISVEYNGENKEFEF